MQRSQFEQDLVTTLVTEYEKVTHMAKAFENAGMLTDKERELLGLVKPKTSPKGKGVPRGESVRDIILSFAAENKEFSAVELISERNTPLSTTHRNIKKLLYERLLRKTKKVSGRQYYSIVRQTTDAEQPEGVGAPAHV